MLKTPAYAAATAGAKLAPTIIERRDPGPKDVLLEILYSGICHSDLHQARDEWGGAIFPMVPGHEIVGRVTQVGKDVTKFKVGDIGAVGCFVDSCGKCGSCHDDLEQFCDDGPAYTYNSTEMDRKTPTFGGYSSQIVVRDHYVLKVPAGLDLAATAPLLCAGITTYSPLRQFNCKKGDRVAVVGLGGLGHMAVKFAVSMGAEVTVLSTSRSKEADARRLGAHAFEVTSEKGVFKKLANRFNLIVDTVSAPHNLNEYFGTLHHHGTLALVGLPPEALPVEPFALVGGNRRFAGSNIGGIKETQEMLDYCAAHGIVSDIETIQVQQVNEAYERLVKNDVRYRFVIDAASLRA